MPEPLIMIVTALPGAPTGAVAIKPFVVRVAESISGGGLELSAAAVTPAGGSPPAITVTVPLATVWRVEAGMTPMVWSWKGGACGAFKGKLPLPHWHTQFMHCPFAWALALFTAPPPAITVTAAPAAVTVVVATRPS